MSRVAYILGAGASYGKREMTSRGNKLFVRGLPVINELEEAVHTIIPRDQYSDYDINGSRAIERGVKDVDGYKRLVQSLIYLKEMCASYPTIDTLARQLYVTHGDYPTEDGNAFIKYDDLKRVLAVALLMLQSHKKRDLRYDAFIASVIDNQRRMPPMTILSWNYDAQFELAYSGYAKDERYIPCLWKELNVLNKTYASDFHPNESFAMIKLNGTAFFTDMRYKDEIFNSNMAGIRDCFFGGGNKTMVQYGVDYMNPVISHNRLSYAWETDYFEPMKEKIIQRVQDTEELVVIGYSFPYVNNYVDEYIISRMARLQKVIIQDPNFEDIKERISTMTYPGHAIEYVPKQWNQFYVPHKF